MSSYFAHARTALKFFLMNNDFGRDSRVLVPNYICDALVHPLNELGIDTVYYNIDDKFQPEWAHLEQIVKHNACHAIVMVHYFGQPQDISRFQQFSKEYNLLLIEDNAHGFGGKINGKLLGSFGDVGIVSPRKTLNVKYGGQLYIDGVLKSAPDGLVMDPPQVLYWVAKKLLLRLSFVGRSVYKFLSVVPDITDATSFKEPIVESMQADRFSSWVINSAILKNQVDLIAEKRRRMWLAVNDVVIEEGGIPVFLRLSDQSSPWAYPFYTSTKNDREVIRARLTRKGYNVFPWPALPAELIVRNVCLHKWNRLLCVSL